MKPGLLELLVCPHDAQPLAANGVGELRAPTATASRFAMTCRGSCRTSRRRYGDQTGTFDSFSAKWSRVDSDEVRQRFEAQYAWYVQRFGFGDEDGLRGFLADKRTVLEAGPDSAATRPASRGCRMRRSSGSTSARASSPPSASSARPRTCTTSRPTCCGPRSRPSASTSSPPTSAFTTRQTPGRRWPRSHGLVAPGGVSRVLRLQGQGAAARVRRRLHPRAHDKDERRGVHGVQRVDERAGPRAVGGRTRPSRSSAEFRCSASSPGSTTSSG